MVTFKLQRLQLLTLAVLIAAFISSGYADDGSNDSEQFKAFIQNPPIISELIFRVKASSNQPGVDRDGYQRFFIKWQSNAFLLRQLAPVDLPTSASPLITNQVKYYNGGAYEDYHWVVGLNNFQEWTGREETNNSVAHVNTMVYSKLCDVLNFGILNVRAGTLRWSNNTFSMPSADAPGVIISGALISSNGRPSLLRLKYGTYDWEVVYTYDKPLSVSYLPSHWDIIPTWQKGRRVISGTYEIVSIELSDHLQDRDQFLPEQIPQLAYNRFHSVFTNGALYNVSSNGLRPYQTNEISVSKYLGLLRPKVKRPLSIGVAVLTVLVVFAPLIAFLIRFTLEKIKTNKGHEK